MKKIFGVGISGLVGSRFTEILKDEYEFENLSIDTGVDITKPESLKKIEDDTEHEAVLLLAAKADVDGSETDKPLGKDGAAWKINVEGARNVAEACRKHKKKLIYISTDFVFHGDDTPDTGYTEDSIAHPINWYGHTKYEAEKIVRSADIPYLIVRIAYPYRTPFPLKKDFVQVILTRLKEGLPIAGVTDHLMSPTFVDDIAHGLDALIRNESIGTFHVTGSQAISPYDAIMTIGRVFGLSTDHVTSTTREEFFKNRAPRPSNLTMNNARIEQLGAKMKSFEEGLQALRAQIPNN